MPMLRLFVLTVLLWSSGAGAQNGSGDSSAGEKLAREVCANCHIVATDQNEDPGVGAPSFVELVADPAVTELSLRVFLRTPHSNMPDLRLTGDETDDIISYLMFLRER